MRVTPHPGIAILGGAFDPIHFGHLRPAEDVRQALGLARILLIPTGQPPHRSRPQASAEQRLAMLELAVAAHPPFEVCDWELQRDAPSYSVDTLTHLRRAHGDTPLYFIIGSDAFLRFDTWQRWQDIPALAHLVVTYRPNWPLPDLPDALKAVMQPRIVQSVEDTRQHSGGKLLFQSVTGLDISSSRIRQIRASGQSPRFLLPDSVLTYMDAHDLYQQEQHHLV